MSWTAPNLAPSSITFAQLQAGGAAGHLEKLIAANLAPTLAPTAAPTIAATGGGSTGGLLQAGTYYAVHTESNGVGETTKSPESAQLTVAAGNIPTVTFPTLKAGNTSRYLYLGAVNGPTGGPYYRYAFDITTTTVNLATAYTLANSYAYQPPATNTTGLTRAKLEMLRAFKDGNGQMSWNFLAQILRTFNQGDPTDLGTELLKIRDAATVFSMIATMINEAGALVSANGGHIANVATGVGGMKAVRQWP